MHLGIGRADMKISQLYSNLSDVGDEFFADILTEFDLTRQLLLVVTEHEEILDTEPWLQHSIRMRNPYVDPMNYVQVALMERLRQPDTEADQQKIQELLAQSIAGIASGLQSVG